MEEQEYGARRQELLTEYQLAQQSAEFHDKLAWTVTGLVMGGEGVLLGYTADNLANNQVATVLLAVVGTFLGVALLLLASGFRWLKNKKYARCKAIEEELGLGQHRATEGYASRLWAFWVVTVLIGTVWVAIAVGALRRPSASPWGDVPNEGAAARAAGDRE